MALPSSGQISLRDIAQELGVSETNMSLNSMAATAGFSAPYSVQQFYGYSHNTVGSFSGTYDSFLSQINLTWTDANRGNPSTDYEIQYRVNSGSWITLDNNVSASANSYAHFGIIGGSSYQYRIRLNNGGSFGDWVESNSIST